MNNQIFSLIGWRYLPDLVTGWIQGIYYSLITRAGEPKPLPGSSRYNRDRRRIYIATVSIYLIFTIYEADWEIRQEGDFYQDLRLAQTATDREIKSRFRRLAALHHPDKVGTRSTSSERYFVQLKLAQDILLDPVKRFAYERFGPAMLEWEHCSTKREYLVQGFFTELPRYFAAALGMYFFEYLGYVNTGNFWRWFAFVSLGLFELRTLSSPYLPPLLTQFLNPILTKYTNHPPFLPFQLLQLAHKVCVTLYIALSQIGPFFQNAITGNPSELALVKKLESLESKSRSIDAEASRSLELEMTPFIRGSNKLESVKEKLKDWLVQNTVKMDPEVRDAVDKAIRRRNQLSTKTGN
ncbi:putative membrane associated chaperone [Golovinomyces cichoracearum]|uniref:Putative membrane associated chaperone n=1 Tax=Golovinomyces cichoracearum TaxID=62708 RepID=A0A420IZ44_9PEZI|nr:putative membrane associated chaperone [Golovinomyces cichoracearum]